MSKANSLSINFKDFLTIDQFGRAPVPISAIVAAIQRDRRFKSSTVRTFIKIFGCFYEVFDNPEPQLTSDCFFYLNCEGCSNTFLNTIRGGENSTETGIIPNCMTGAFTEENIVQKNVNEPPQILRTGFIPNGLAYATEIELSSILKGTLEFTVLNRQLTKWDPIDGIVLEIYGKIILQE